MTARWEPSFVAIAALLGEPADAIEAELGTGREHAGELLRSMRSPDRTARARAMAAVITEIAMTLERVRLA
jgi:hypothetical protein